MAKPTGALFYRGPSLIDGEEIVAIATTGTSNRKTGDMIQTWILRTSHSPTEAVRLGHDRSICGGCPHRTGPVRTCYVNVGQAPQAVWNAFKRRRYPKMDLREFVLQRDGQALRLGSYGDPTAVPLEYWGAAAELADGRAGYTHQWRTCDQDWRHLIMASCDSPAEAMDAAMLGWRSFLVRPVNDPAPPAKMIECLSESRGRTCEQCALCFGAHPSAPSIWITAHGSAKRFVGVP